MIPTKNVLLAFISVRKPDFDSLFQKIIQGFAFLVILMKCHKKCIFICDFLKEILEFILILCYDNTKVIDFQAFILHKAKSQAEE